MFACSIARLACMGAKCSRNGKSRNDARAFLLDWSPALVMSEPGSPGTTLRRLRGRQSGVCRLRSVATGAGAGQTGAGRGQEIGMEHKPRTVLRLRVQRCR